MRAPILSSNEFTLQLSNKKTRIFPAEDSGQGVYITLDSIGDNSEPCNNPPSMVVFLDVSSVFTVIAALSNGHLRRAGKLSFNIQEELSTGFLSTYIPVIVIGEAALYMLLPFFESLYCNKAVSKPPKPSSNVFLRHLTEYMPGDELVLADYGQL